MLQNHIPNFRRDTQVYAQANFLHPSYKGCHLKSDEGGAYEQMLKETKDFSPRRNLRTLLKKQKWNSKLMMIDGPCLCHLAKAFYNQFQTKLRFTWKWLNQQLAATLTLLVFGRVMKNSFLNWQIWQGPFSPFLQVQIQQTDVSLRPTIAGSSKIVNDQEAIFCHQNFSSLAPFLPKWTHLSSEFMSERRPGALRNKDSAADDNDSQGEWR